MVTIGEGRASRGQGAVEFALVLPIVLLLTLGAFDFGRAIFYNNMLSGAAREGTRYGMVHGASSGSPVGPGSGSYTPPNQDSTVTAVVRGHVFALDPSDVTVLSTWPDGDSAAGHRMRVEVRYTYTPLTGTILGGASVVLDNVSEARIAY